MQPKELLRKGGGKQFSPVKGKAPNKQPSVKGSQVKLLNKGEIKKLKEAGYNIHTLKGKKGASKFDLYKDSKGNIIIKRKGGLGPGELLEINISELQ